MRFIRWTNRNAANAIIERSRETHRKPFKVRRSGA
jgi:hypothetical protein